MFRREVYFSCKFDDLFQSVKAKLPVASVTQKSMEPAILSFILANDHPSVRYARRPGILLKTIIPARDPKQCRGGVGG